MAAFGVAKDCIGYNPDVHKPIRRNVRRLQKISRVNGRPGGYPPGTLLIRFAQAWLLLQIDHDGRLYAVGIVHFATRVEVAHRADEDRIVSVAFGAARCTNP